MLSPIVLPVPVAVAAIALLAVIIALGTLQVRLEDYLERYLAWQPQNTPLVPAPALIEDRPFALPSPVGRPVTVVPGRHRLENVLEFPGPVYRPQAWPTTERPFVGALSPISARPFIAEYPVSAPPAFRALEAAL